MKNMGIISSYGIINDDFKLCISLDIKDETNGEKYNVYIDKNQNILQLDVNEVYHCDKTIGKHIEMFLNKKIEFIIKEENGKSKSTNEVITTKKPSYKVTGIIYHHEL